MWSAHLWVLHLKAYLNDADGEGGEVLFHNGHGWGEQVVLMVMALVAASGMAGEREAAES